MRSQFPSRVVFTTIVSEMPLSPRLQLLHDGFRPGYPAFDLCCDHGYLGLGALISDRVPHVTFVDRVPAIIDQLCDRFPVALDNRRATFVTADAATLLPRPVHGTIAIAGVGAQVLLDIFGAFALPSLQEDARLVLQPESRADEVAEVVRRAGLSVNAHEVVDNGIAHAVLLCTR